MFAYVYVLLIILLAMTTTYFGVVKPLIPSREKKQVTFQDPCDVLERNCKHEFVVPVVSGWFGTVGWLCVSCHKDFDTIRGREPTPLELAEAVADRRARLGYFMVSEHPDLVTPEPEPPKITVSKGGEQVLVETANMPSFTLTPTKTRKERQAEEHRRLMETIRASQARDRQRRLTQVQQRYDRSVGFPGHVPGGACACGACISKMRSDRYGPSAACHDCTQVWNGGKHTPEYMCSGTCSHYHNYYE